MMNLSRVLVYHKVDSRFEWGLTRVTPSRFEQQIVSLLDRGFRLVTLRELCGHPGDERRIALTFDDAYESVYHNAFPVLQKYNVHSTLFVVTDFIGRKNSWDVNYGGRCFRHMTGEQLQEMAAAGHELASHTCTHNTLTEKSRGEIWRELSVSRQTLKSLVPQQVRYIAYPFARYDQRVLDLTAEAGYAGGCIFMRENPHVVINGTPLIYRQGVYLHDTSRSVISKVTPGFGFRWQRFQQNLINWAAGGSVVMKRWRGE